MKGLLERINRDISAEKLNEIWPDFKQVASALYNKQHVYVFHHPMFSTAEKNEFIKLDWNEQFVGDTFILYEDYPTAIVNLERYSDYESIYSLLVHELFHGYQFLLREGRFPNEFMGFQYPMVEENIELRTRERRCLYNAIHSDNDLDKRQNIHQFIHFREKRNGMMNCEFMQYEYMVESVEGPAWYVEMNAYSKVGTSSYQNTLQKYSGLILDTYDAASNIRRSCYSSGMILCLLLDEIAPDWKTRFLKTKQSLYDFFKQSIEIEIDQIQIDEIKIEAETKEIIKLVKKQREIEFRAFHHQEGYHLFIRGNMQVDMLNPMNLILDGNRLLHRGFLGLRIHNKQYMIQQPIISYFKERIQDIEQVHFVISEKPIKSEEGWSVLGVGNIKGEYEEKGNSIFLNIK